MADISDINTKNNKFNIDNIDSNTLLSNDFLDYLASITDEEEKIRVEAKARNKAKELKQIKPFNELLKVKQKKNVLKQKQKNVNTMNFINCPVEGLDSGEWSCTNKGVTKQVYTVNGPQTVKACPHPILPAKRLVNIDTNTEKLKIAFYKDKKWKYITENKSTIASKFSIIQLSDKGIEVNSETARELILYIADILEFNVDKFIANDSIGRLGWTDKGFAPYVEELEYDGDSSFRDVFENMQEKGSYEEWKKTCIELRKNKIVHLMLASSFASSLIQKIGTLPFIVNVWGGTEAGKTVGLMVAMSVWGNPELRKISKDIKLYTNSISKICFVCK